MPPKLASQRRGFLLPSIASGLCSITTPHQQRVPSAGHNSKKSLSVPPSLPEPEPLSNWPPALVACCSAASRSSDDVSSDDVMKGGKQVRFFFLVELCLRGRRHAPAHTSYART